LLVTTQRVAYTHDGGLRSVPLSDLDTSRISLKAGTVNGEITLFMRNGEQLNFRRGMSLGMQEVATAIEQSAGETSSRRRPSRPHPPRVISRRPQRLSPLRGPPAVAGRGPAMTSSSSTPQSAASNTIRARCANPARTDEDRVHKDNTARSAAGTCTPTVNAMHHNPTR
jgi:hypothetical protein